MLLSNSQHSKKENKTEQNKYVQEVSHDAHPEFKV